MTMKVCNLIGKTYGRTNVIKSGKLKKNSMKQRKALDEIGVGTFYRIACVCGR